MAYQNYDDPMDIYLRHDRQYRLDEQVNQGPPISWQRLQSLSIDEARGVLVGLNAWDLRVLAQAAGIKRWKGLSRKMLLQDLEARLDVCRDV